MEKVGPIICPEISVNNNKQVLHNNTEEQGLIYTPAEVLNLAYLYPVCNVVVDFLLNFPISILG